MSNIHSVLFVCTGNSCRSVMAEGLMKKRLKELGKTSITVSSAGVRAITGFPPTYETVEVMKQSGVDLNDFKSTAMSKELIEAADLILVMSRSHKEDVVKCVPSADSKTFLLREYGRTEGSPKPDVVDIPDPIGLPVSSYKECLDMIKEDIERVANIL
ncbi:MAG: low molecular weight protein arginine phosphatase [Candidatus Omnitrophica bacterium]|nr:low molecular weight protein arginine phosphatase [Candidatus Omnitrophota bacterium]